MRILAVGWENLASLARGPAPQEPGGERLLWLDRPPLSQVGVFAIMGPTGSGKSTILDAICLALFDATPRLAKRGGVKVGRSAEEAEIASYDTRNLLRRGAGEGCAICIFEGRDGLRYRATWSVRRARQSPSGRLQKVEMTLHEEPGGAPIGRTNSEVQEEIRQRLGLDFDQFRRSVLLAQGEFAAFLGADGDERADLLEKVTGTALYALIGREAFERAGREDLALAQLLKDRSSLGLLDDDGRSTLESDAAWLGFRAEQAEFALTQARDALRRAAELARLERRALEAKGDLKAAEGAWAALGPEVTRRDGLRAVRAHVGTLQGWDRASRAHATAELALAEARRVEATATEARRRARLAWVRAARAAVEEAEGAEGRRRAQRDARDAERRQLEQALVGELSPDVDLAARWAVTGPRLEAAVLASEALARAGAKAEQLLAAREEAQAAHAAAERALAGAAARASDAERAEASARSGEGTATAAAVQGAVEEAQAAEARLARLAELHGRAGALAAAAAGWRAEAAEAATRVQGARTRALEERAHQAAAQREEPGVEAALRRARATVELAQHRDALVPGEPCPLCGAEEHPWGAAVPPVDAVLEALSAQLVELRARIALHGEAAGAAEAEAELAVQHAGRASARARSEDEALAGLTARWLADGEGLGLPPIADEGAAAALAAASEAVAGRLAAARAALVARRDWERRVEALADAAREARAGVDAARGARDEALARLLQTQADEQAHGQAQADDRARVAAASADLGDEAAAFRADPAATLEAARARVGRVQRVQAARELLARQLEADGAALADASTAVAVARARLEAVREAVGPEVAAAADAADAAEAAQAADEPGAARAAEAADRAARSAVGAREQAESVLDERVAARDGAREALDAALRELGLDEATLRAKGAELPGLPVLEATLQAAEQRVASAASVLADRQTHLDEQRARRGPPLTAAEAGEVVWTVGGFGGDVDDSPTELAMRAEREVRALHEALGRVAEQLRRDDASRAQGAELDAEIAAQRRVCAVWGSMRELIGDAQGKRFRSFAQSLTLDLLLTEANAHLEELEPRYRMERAPPVDGRALLALQVVDRDMGDEVRPTSSLSGGESFLVSLALALALSSLSADGNTVGSLFIDEGFGTLDEKTLETALSVLEALQAGGRQVGIISHVQKLAENIGAQVVVQPEAPGLSRVSVAGPGYS